MLVALVCDRVAKSMGSGLINSAGPFSLPVNFAVLVCLAVVIVLFIAYLFLRSWQHGSLVESLALGLMLVGGASNVYDRLSVGGVIDVIHVAQVMSFNLADVYLTVGVLLLLVKWRYSKPCFR